MRPSLMSLLSWIILAPLGLASERPVIIAHRGASGYLPEHTLAGVAMAHGFGVDYVEPDVILTKDDVPIVLHDLHLDGTTDVATVFPGRRRADGRHYAIDFTLEEIRRLSVRERVDPKTGRLVFPLRFSGAAPRFGVPTLEEFVALVQGLNRSTGRSVGIYLEPKDPEFHAKEGKDLVAAIEKVLAARNLKGRESGVVIQCFDPTTLRRLRRSGAAWPLTQLVGEASWSETQADWNRMKTKEGLRDVKSYADAIGFWYPQVLSGSGKGTPKPSGLAKSAKALGLDVFVYTLRRDQLPEWASSLEGLADQLKEVGVDGFFTDHPDVLVKHYERR